MGDSLTPEDRQELYAWIDKVPLSRQKRNITRDFSDGVMAAELVHHFFPRLVDLHNYTSANSTSQKLNNWRTLNRKAFVKLDFEVPDHMLQDIVASQPGVIEYLLTHFKTKVEQFHHQKKGNPFLLPVYNESTSQVQELSMSPNSHISSLLPPLNSLDHTTKSIKPSHIPRPKYSGHRSTLHSQTLPSQSHSNKSEQTAKLPPIKDGGIFNKKKPVSSYNIHYAHPLSKPEKSTSIEMAEKDQVIMELQETIQLLSMKVNRLEHLVHLKDYRIQELEKIIMTTSNINNKR